MNKFQLNLTRNASQIKASRALRVTESAKMEMESFLHEAKRNVHQIKTEILEHSDLNVSSGDSLEAIRGGFKPASWVSQVAKAKKALVEAEEELEVAQELYESWFGTDVSAEDEDEAAANATATAAIKDFSTSVTASINAELAE